MSSYQIVSYELPFHKRKCFKKPLGELIKSEKKISNKISELKHQTDIPFIIAVGDATTNKLLGYSLIPDLAIIDEHIERKKIEPFDTSGFSIVEVSNPPGEITEDAWREIRLSLQKESIKIVIKIDGEEDLLALPAVLESPLNSKVLYGQPKEGLVVVTVTEERKAFVNNLMKKMVIK